MNKKREAGFKGEGECIEVLKKSGFNFLIEEPDNMNSPFDVLVERDRIKYALNIKSISKKNGVFCIQNSNILRLKKSAKEFGAIGGYVLFFENQFYILTFIN